ncbi:hypothetical protein AKO1_007661 [Acrasis kona]|uniref:Transcription factor n=1 Tax=Acrasis kona TaxID=1008807 RepID=A0AAW2YQY3_9EUKA
MSTNGPASNKTPIPNTTNPPVTLPAPPTINTLNGNSTYPQPPVFMANVPPAVLMSGAVPPGAPHGYQNYIAQMMQQQGVTNAQHPGMMFYMPYPGMQIPIAKSESGDKTKEGQEGDANVQPAAMTATMDAQGTIINDPSNYSQFPFMLYPMMQQNLMNPLDNNSKDKSLGKRKNGPPPPASSTATTKKVKKNASSPTHQASGSRNVGSSSSSGSSSTKDSTRANKGLRHFSMKVCEQVQHRGTTTYNDVATELVNEIMDQNQTTNSKPHDAKNIRRRVYDALNVLMALNIISKDKKEIRWKGLPVNYHQEYDNLKGQKQQHSDNIAMKEQQFNELLRQQRALSNLYTRNIQPEFADGNPRVELPFIIVQTANETLIECEMDQEGTEVYFNFNQPFEIHDDNEILYRLGLDEEIYTYPNLVEQLNQMPAHDSTMIVEESGTVGDHIPESNENE